MASLADALAYQQKRQQMLNALNDQPTDLEKAVQDQFGMQPNMDRGALLPYKSKENGWVAPEVAYQLAKLLASPSVAMHGGNISPQEAIESGNTLSGFMTPAGLLSKPSPAMARMNVYHGSPHEFDAFDASKIGTGEGAQAYGHGLYLAESPEVAEGYRKALSTFQTTINGVPLTPSHPQFSAGMEIASRGYDKALADARSAVASGFVDPAYGRQHIAAIEALKNATIKQNQSGNVYKVDLPDEWLPKMLDWDKPLSQQAPEVQKAMYKALVDRGITKSVADYIVSNKSGKEALATLARGSYDARLNVPDGQLAADASLRLRQAGIPGIRYLDEGSRASGAGTSNFVVFPGEEHNLKILKRE